MIALLALCKLSRKRKVNIRSYEKMDLASLRSLELAACNFIGIDLITSLLLLINFLICIPCAALTLVT